MGDYDIAGNNFVHKSHKNPLIVDKSRWAIAIMLSLTLWSERKHLVLFLLSRPSLLWAVLSFALLIGVYLFTEEVRGLIQRDNFSRAAMLSALLFTVSLSTESWKRWYKKA